MEYGQAESSLPQEIPIKGFQVPDVEDDAMSLRDGPVVKSIRLYNREETIAAHSRIMQPLEQNGLEFQTALRPHRKPPDSKTAPVFD